MEYNKRQFQKANDKKVMHKVKKHWVVMSMALLMAIGGKAVAMQTGAHASSNDDDHDNQNSVNTLRERLNQQLVQGRKQAVQSQNNASVNNADRTISPKIVNQQANVLHDRILENAGFINAQRQQTDNGRVKGQTTPNSTIQNKPQTNNSNETTNNTNTVNNSGRIHVQKSNNANPSSPSQQNDSASKVNPVIDHASDQKSGKSVEVPPVVVGSSNTSWHDNPSGINASYRSFEASWDGTKVTFYYDPSNFTQGYVVVKPGDSGEIEDNNDRGGKYRNDVISGLPTNCPFYDPANTGSEYESDRGKWHLIIESSDNRDVKMSSNSNEGRQFAASDSDEPGNNYTAIWNNFSTMDLSGLDLSGVSDISDMFKGDTYLQSVRLGSKKHDGTYTTTGVKDMSNLFDIGSGANLQDINVSDLDTSTVSNMSHMFSVDSSSASTSPSDSNLTALDVSNFNTQNVVSAQGMFEGDSGLNNIIGLNFKLPKVTDMSYMFQDDPSLRELNLSNIDTSTTANPKPSLNMSHMASDDSSLFKIDGVSTSSPSDNVAGINSKLVTPRTTTISDMFSNDGALGNDGEYVNLSGFNLNHTHNEVVNNLFKNDSSLKNVNFDMDLSYAVNPELGNSDNTSTNPTSSSHNDGSSDSIFDGDSNLTNIVANMNLKGASDVDMSSLFGNLSALQTIDVSKFTSSDAKNGRMDYLFENDPDLANVVGISVTDSDKPITNPITNGSSSLNSSFVTPKFSDLSDMFYRDQSTNLTDLDVSNFKLSDASNARLSDMFTSDTNLKKVWANINMSGANTVRLNNMFLSDGSLTNVYANMKLPNVTTAQLSDMFHNNVVLNYVDISNADNGTGTNSINTLSTRDMFSDNGHNGSGLTINGVDSNDQNSNFITSSHNYNGSRYLKDMFHNNKMNSSLALDLSRFDLSDYNGTNMSDMVSSNTGLTAINTATPNNSNRMSVEGSSKLDMSDFISNNSDLTSINANINAENLKSDGDNYGNRFYQMIYNNANLQSINVSDLTTNNSKTIDMSHMIDSNGNSGSGITSIRGIDSSDQNPNLVTPGGANDFYKMFNSDNLHTDINISKFNLESDNQSGTSDTNDVTDSNAYDPNELCLQNMFNDNSHNGSGTFTVSAMSSDNNSRMNLSNTKYPNLQYMFNNNADLKSANASINLTNSSDANLEYLFNTNSDISDISVSDMTTDGAKNFNMYYLFNQNGNKSGASGITFNGIDPNDQNPYFVTPGVNNLSNMFYSDKIKTPVYINAFDLQSDKTSNLSLQYMFNQNHFVDDASGSDSGDGIVAHNSNPMTTISSQNPVPQRMNMSHLNGAQMQHMFYENSDLANINASIDLDYNNVNNSDPSQLYRMFDENGKLVRISVSDMTTIKGKSNNMSDMFYENGTSGNGIAHVRGIDNSDQNSDLVIPNDSNAATVNKMDYMFDQNKFASDGNGRSVPLNISKFNVSGDKTTSDISMSNMFNENNGLTHVELAYRKDKSKPYQQMNIDQTSNANLSYMLNSNPNLFGVDANFMIGSAQKPDMTYMFTSNPDLHSVDMRNLDTSHSRDVNMSYIFNSDGNGNSSATLGPDSNYGFGSDGDLADPTAHFEVHGMAHSDEKSGNYANGNPRHLNTKLITPAVSNMSHMFNKDQDMRDVDVKGFRTSNNGGDKTDQSDSSDVDMDNMFNDDSDLPFIIGINSDFTSSDNSDMGQLAGQHISDCASSDFVRYGVKNLSQMFNNDAHLHHLNVRGFRVDQSSDDKRVNMSNMFNKLPSAKNIGGIDGTNSHGEGNNPYLVTKDVSDLSDFFASDTNLNKVDVTAFDTRNVSDMNYMFNNNPKLTRIDGINSHSQHFDVSHANKMSNMFNSDTSLSDLDVTNFKHAVSDVSMARMFTHDNSLHRIVGISDGNQNSDFVTSDVSNMTEMFNSDSALSDVNISKFHLSTANQSGNATNPSDPKATNNSNVSLSSNNEIVSGTSDGNVISNTDNGFFTGDSDGYVNMSYLFNDNPSLANVNANVDLSNANKIDMSHMFNGNKLTNVDISNLKTYDTNATSANPCKAQKIDMPYLFTNNTFNKNAEGHYGVKGLEPGNTSSSIITPGVSDVAFMFNQNSGLSDVDLSAVNMNKPNNHSSIPDHINMSDMFYKNANLTNVNANMKMEHIQQLDMSDMFNSNPVLTTVDASHLDLSNANSDKTSEMQVQGHNSDGPTGINNSFSYSDTNNPIYLHQMFNANPALQKVDLSQATTQGAQYVNMNQMFNSDGANGNFTAIDGIDAASQNPNLVTPGVVNMSYMFNDNNLGKAGQPGYLDIHKFNVSNNVANNTSVNSGLNMSYMFNNNNFNNGSVYADGMNMQNTQGVDADHAFNVNQNLKRVDAGIDLSSKNSSKTQSDNLSYFFNSDQQLDTINLNDDHDNNGFSTQGDIDTNLSHFFNSDKALKEIIGANHQNGNSGINRLNPTFVTKGVNNISYMFNKDQVLSDLDVMDFDTRPSDNQNHGTVNVDGLFSNMPSIKWIQGLDATQFDWIPKDGNTNNSYNQSGHFTQDPNSIGPSRYGKGSDNPNLITTSAKSLYRLFNNDPVLTDKYLDLSNFNTTSASDMRYMFASDPSIMGIDFDLPNANDGNKVTFSTSKVSNSIYNSDRKNSDNSSASDYADGFNYMFSNDSALQVLDLSSFDTKTNSNNLSTAFNNDNLLTTMKLGQKTNLSTAANDDIPFFTPESDNHTYSSDNLYANGGKRTNIMNSNGNDKTNDVRNGKQTSDWYYGTMDARIVYNSDTVDGTNNRHIVNTNSSYASPHSVILPDVLRPNNPSDMSRNDGQYSINPNLYGYRGPTPYIPKSDKQPTSDDQRRNDQAWQLYRESQYYNIVNDINNHMNSDTKLQNDYIDNNSIHHYITHFGYMGHYSDGNNEPTTYTPPMIQLNVNNKYNFQGYMWGGLNGSPVDIDGTHHTITVWDPSKIRGNFFTHTNKWLIDNNRYDPGNTGHSAGTQLSGPGTALDSLHLDKLDSSLGDNNWTVIMMDQNDSSNQKTAITTNAKNLFNGSDGTGKTYGSADQIQTIKSGWLRKPNLSLAQQFQLTSVNSDIRNGKYLTTTSSDLSGMYANLHYLNYFGVGSDKNQPLMSSDVTTMNNMFKNDYRLSDIAFPQLNMSESDDNHFGSDGNEHRNSTYQINNKIHSMNDAFANDNSLAHLDLSGIDTTGAANANAMNDMLNNDQSLATLKLGGPLNLNDPQGQSVFFAGVITADSGDNSLGNGGGTGGDIDTSDAVNNRGNIVASDIAHGKYTYHHADTSDGTPFLDNEFYAARPVPIYWYSVTGNKVPNRNGYDPKIDALVPGVDASKITNYHGIGSQPGYISAGVQKIIDQKDPIEIPKSYSVVPGQVYSIVGTKNGQLPPLKKDKYGHWTASAFIPVEVSNSAVWSGYTWGNAKVVLDGSSDSDHDKIIVSNGTIGGDVPLNSDDLQDFFQDIYKTSNEGNGYDPNDQVGTIHVKYNASGQTVGSDTFNSWAGNTFNQSPLSDSSDLPNGYSNANTSNDVSTFKNKYQGNNKLSGSDQTVTFNVDGSPGSSTMGTIRVSYVDSDNRSLGLSDVLNQPVGTQFDLGPFEKSTTSDGYMPNGLTYVGSDTAGMTLNSSDKGTFASGQHTIQIKVNEPKSMKTRLSVLPNDDPNWQIVFRSDVHTPQDGRYLFSNHGNNDGINDDQISKIDLRNLDTSNLHNADHMFTSDHHVKNIDLGNLGANFGQNNVSDLSGMFQSDTNLRDPQFNVNTKNFDTSKVTNMQNMFKNDPHLYDLNLSTFDTNSLQNAESDFYGDFHSDGKGNSTGLTILNLGSWHLGKKITGNGKKNMFGSDAKGRDQNLLKLVLNQDTNLAGNGANFNNVKFFTNNIKSDGSKSTQLIDAGQQRNGNYYYATLVGVKLIDQDGNIIPTTDGTDDGKQYTLLSPEYIDSQNSDLINDKKGILASDLVNGILLSNGKQNIKKDPYWTGDPQLQLTSHDYAYKLLPFSEQNLNTVYDLNKPYPYYLVNVVGKYNSSDEPINIVYENNNDKGDTTGQPSEQHKNVNITGYKGDLIHIDPSDPSIVRFKPDKSKIVDVPSGYKVSHSDLNSSDFDAQLTPNGFRWLHGTPTVHFVSSTISDTVTIHQYLISLSGRLIDVSEPTKKALYGNDPTEFPVSGSINRSYTINEDKYKSFKGLPGVFPIDGELYQDTTGLTAAQQNAVQQFIPILRSYENQYSYTGHFMNNDNKGNVTLKNINLYYLDLDPSTIDVHFILDNTDDTKDNGDEVGSRSLPGFPDEPLFDIASLSNVVDLPDAVSKLLPKGFRPSLNDTQIQDLLHNNTFGTRPKSINVPVKGDDRSIQVHFISDASHKLLRDAPAYTRQVGDWTNMLKHVKSDIPDGYYLDPSFDTNYHVSDHGSDKTIDEYIPLEPSGDFAPVTFYSDYHPNHTIGSDGYAIGNPSSKSVPIEGLNHHLGYHFANGYSDLDIKALNSDGSGSKQRSRVPVVGNAATVNLHYIDQNGSDITNTIPEQDRQLTGHIDGSDMIQYLPAGYKFNNSDDYKHGDNVGSDYHFDSSQIKSQAKDGSDTMYDYNVYVHRVYAGTPTLPVNVVFMNNSDESSSNQLSPYQVHISLGGGYVGQHLHLTPSDIVDSNANENTNPAWDKTKLPYNLKTLSIPAGYTLGNSASDSSWTATINGLNSAYWGTDPNIPSNTPTIYFKADKVDRKIHITQIKELPNGQVTGIDNNLLLDLDQTHDQNVGNSYSIDPGDQRLIPAPAGYQLKSGNPQISGRITSDASIDSGVTDDHFTLYYVADSDNNDISVTYEDKNGNKVPGSDNPHDFNHDGKHYYGQKVSALNYIPNGYVLDTTDFPNQTTQFEYDNSDQNPVVHVSKASTHDSIRIKLVLERPDGSQMSSDIVSDLPNTHGSATYRITPNDPMFSSYIKGYTSDTTRNKDITGVLTPQGPKIITPKLSNNELPTFYYKADTNDSIEVEYVDQNGQPVSDNGGNSFDNTHRLTGYTGEPEADVTTDPKSPLPLYHDYLAGKKGPYTFLGHQTAEIIVRGQNEKVPYRFVYSDNGTDKTVGTGSVSGLIGNTITLPDQAPRGYYVSSRANLNYTIGPVSPTGGQLVAPQQTIYVQPDPLIEPIVFKDKNTGNVVGYSSLHGTTSDTSERVSGLPRGYQYVNLALLNENTMSKEGYQYKDYQYVNSDNIDYDFATAPMINSDVMQTGVIPVVGKLANVHVFYKDSNNTVASDYVTGNIGSDVQLNSGKYDIEGGNQLKYVVDNTNALNYIFNPSQISNDNPLTMNDYIVPVHGAVVSDTATIKIMEEDPYRHQLYDKSTAPTVQIPVTGEIGDNFQITASDIEPNGYQPDTSVHSDVLNGTIKSDGSLSKNSDTFWYISTATTLGLKRINVNYVNSDNGLVAAQGYIDPSQITSDYDGKLIPDIIKWHLITIPSQQINDGSVMFEQDPNKFYPDGNQNWLPDGYKLSGDQDLSTISSQNQQTVTVMVSPNDEGGNSSDALPLKVTYVDSDTGSDVGSTNPFQIDSYVGDLINIPQVDHVPDGYYLVSNVVNGYPVDAYPITSSLVNSPSNNVTLKVRSMSSDTKPYDLKIKLISPHSDGSDELSDYSDQIQIQNGTTFTIDPNKYNPSPNYYQFIPSQSTSQLTVTNHNKALSSSTGTLVYRARSTNSDQGLSLGTIKIRYFDGSHQIKLPNTGDYSDLINTTYDGEKYTVSDLIKKFGSPSGYTLDNSDAQKREAYVLGPSSSHQDASIYFHGASDHAPITVHVVREGPDGQIPRDKNNNIEDESDTIELNGEIGDTQTITPSEYFPTYPSDTYSLDTTNGRDQNVNETLQSGNTASQPDVTFYYRAAKRAVKPITVDFIAGDFNNDMDTETISEQTIEPRSSDYNGKFISDVTHARGIKTPSGYSVVSPQNLSAMFSNQPVHIGVWVTPISSGNMKKDYSHTLNEIEELYHDYKDSQGKHHEQLIGTRNVPITEKGIDGTRFTLNPPIAPAGYQVDPNYSNPTVSGYILKDGLYEAMSDNGTKSIQESMPLNDVVYKFEAKDSANSNSSHPSDAQPLEVTYHDVKNNTNVQGPTRIDGYMGETIDVLKPDPLPGGYHLALDQNVDYTIQSGSPQNITIDVNPNSTTNADVYHYDIIVEDPDGNVIPQYSRAVKSDVSNKGSITIDPSDYDPIPGNNDSKNYYSDVTPDLNNKPFKVTDNGGKFTLFDKNNKSDKSDKDVANASDLKLIYKAKRSNNVRPLDVQYYDGHSYYDSPMLIKSDMINKNQLYYGERLTAEQLAQIVQPPTGFTVNANQDQTYTIGDGNEPLPGNTKATIFVHGKPVDPINNRAIVNIVEKDTNGKVINRYSEPDFINGELLDRYVIEPDAFTPKGYQPTSSDMPLVGMISNNGNSEVTFNYQAVAKAQPIYVSYINQSGKKVISDQRLTGNYGDSVNVSNAIAVPGDYQLVPGQNANCTFNNHPQFITLQVNGAPTRNYYYVDIVENNGGNGVTHLSPQKVEINGHVGDAVTIRPTQYLPDGYHLNPADRDQKVTLTDNGDLTDPDAVHFVYDEDPAEAHVIYEDLDNHDYTVLERSIYGNPGDSINYDQYCSSDQVPEGYAFDSLGNHNSKLADGDNEIVYVRPTINFGSISVKYVLGDNPNAQPLASDDNTGVVGSDFSLAQFENNLPSYLSGYQFDKVLNGQDVTNYQSHNQQVTIALKPVPSNYGTVTINYVMAKDPEYKISQTVVSGYDGEPFDLGAYEYNAPAGWYYHDILNHKYVDNFVKGENQQITVEVDHI